MEMISPEFSLVRIISGWYMSDSELNKMYDVDSSRANCAEEQCHQQNGLSFFILHKTQLTFRYSVTYSLIFIGWIFIPLKENVNITLSLNIAASSNKHVSFLLSSITLAGLLLGMVLSVCTFVSIIWLIFLHYPLLLILLHVHTTVNLILPHYSCIR